VRRFDLLVDVFPGENFQVADVTGKQPTVQFQQRGVMIVGVAHRRNGLKPVMFGLNNRTTGCAGQASVILNRCS
jgi:hypothetical protein